MAFKVLAHGGWELYYPNNGGTILGGALQDTWKFGASGSVQTLDGSNVRTGDYAVQWARVGLGDDIEFSGHYEARTQDYQFWVVCWKLTGFQLPNDLANTDQYMVCRFANKLIPAGGNRYLALSVKMVDVTASPKTYQPVIVDMHNDGSKNTDLGALPTVPFGTSYHMAVIRARISDRALKGFFDGDAGTVLTTPATGITFHERYIPQNNYLAGKTADKGMNIWYDDWGSGDGASDTDVPGTTWGCFLHQPIADKTGESPDLDTWTGNPDTANQYYNWCDRNRAGSPPVTDKNTPGTINTYQVSDMALAPTGTPLGVRLCYTNVVKDPMVTVHIIAARTTGAIKDIAVGTHPGNIAEWVGRNLKDNPEGAAWTFANLNTLDAGLKAGDATTGTEEFYALVAGLGLTKPTATPVPAAGFPYSQAVII